MTYSFAATIPVSIDLPSERAEIGENVHGLDFALSSDVLHQFAHLRPQLLCQRLPLDVGEQTLFDAGGTEQVHENLRRKNH